MVVLAALLAVISFGATSCSNLKELLDNQKEETTQDPASGTGSSACENKTGFVICIPDGFKL